MNKIRVEEIVKATGGRIVCRGSEEYITGIKHDSRECTEGDMFVAVCGVNRDGHKYISQVLKKGCKTVLISHDGDWIKDIKEHDATAIMTTDTVYAMGELAKYYLETLNIKKIAVTGSVGKTSVRDMIYYVLSEKYNCGRNMKNFNNDIGLPLSIFTFDDSTEAAVLEMGMSDFGEIDRLADIVKPDIGVITNIGISHMENLGSREGIFKAKMEIAKHIPSKEKHGALVYAGSDMLTKERTAGNYKQISIGEEKENDYIISSIDDMGIDGIKFTLKHLEQKYRISLPVPGKHNAVNGSIAVAVGELFGISAEDAVTGLCKTQLTGRRLKYIKGRHVNVIDDTYNASPDSMKSALMVLKNSGGSARKVAVLGDMYELGEESSGEHFDVGRFAGVLGVDLIVAIGEDSEKIAEGAAAESRDAVYFREKEEFFDKIDELIGFGDIILVKGSRGMKMEQIVEKLLEY